MFIKLLTLLLIFFSLLLNFTSRTSGQECPYPCYHSAPDIIISNHIPPCMPTHPYQHPHLCHSHPLVSNNFPPPVGGGYNNFPYNSPPNGYVNGVVPPPPDPILPWWPYRYKNRPDQFSSSVSIQESTTMMMITVFPLLSLFFTLLFH
ncbi:hypothetical protein RND71_010633 [Anisodus tanguticus]|uniref:Uncharacterized protein n=1 Tax=Anisodus tanguticus TaxID=243964 RepID=A0AAE1SHG5_9SOLA|nr:hypothetical protein RND71_010633 [Anisodus tanguticus]